MTRVHEARRRSIAASPAPVLLRRCHGTVCTAGQCQQPVASGGERLPHIVHDVLRSPGHALDVPTRLSMESRFNRDFSTVRIHADAAAAEAAAAVNAAAYTIGRDIVFAARQYAPETPVGRTLLAHELVHTIQAGDGTVPPPAALRMSEPSDATEREAAAAAAAVGGKSRAEVTRRSEPGMVRRQAGGEERLPPTAPPQTGPPVLERPLPPICSLIWEGGKFYWKCEHIPKIGSTPKVPLDPRDIPGEFGKILPKPPAAGKGPLSVPLPTIPGQPDFPSRWLETLCQRDPTSLLCTIKPPPKPAAPPSTTPTLPAPVGVFWTETILFKKDRPGVGDGDPGLTSDGVKALDRLKFTLEKVDPTLQVRLIGHASSEGDDAYNQALSERRAWAIAQNLGTAGLEGRLSEPPKDDGKESGCNRLKWGVWACGKTRAAQGGGDPNDRKVEATFLRNAPLTGLPGLNVPK